MCGVPGAASGSHGWGRRGEGRWGAGGLVCGTLISPLIFLWLWQIFGAATSSCGPFTGSWEPPHELLSFFCPSSSHGASPGLCPQPLHPQATSSLFLPEDSLQLLEGPSASPVGHSYLPSPTSPAPGNAARWATCCCWSRCSSWQMPCPSAAPSSALLSCVPKIGGHTHAPVVC